MVRYRYIIGFMSDEVMEAPVEAGPRRTAPEAYDTLDKLRSGFPDAVKKIFQSPNVSGETEKPYVAYRGDTIITAGHGTTKQYPFTEFGFIKQQKSQGESPEELRYSFKGAISGVNWNMDPDAIQKLFPGIPSGVRQVAVEIAEKDGKKVVTVLYPDMSQEVTTELGRKWVELHGTVTEHGIEADSGSHVDQQQLEQLEHALTLASDTAVHLNIRH